MSGLLKSRRVLLAALAGTVSLTVAHAPANADTLWDAMIAAYNGNPTLRAQRAQLRATDENAAQARAAGRFNVNASGNYQWALQQSEAPGIAAEDTQFGFATPPTDNTLETGTYTGSVTVEQPIFQGFRTWNSIRAADAQVRAGRATLVEVEQNVLLAAVTAYMDVMRDLEVVTLGENNVQVLERQLQAARDRFEVGEITRTDVAQAEARLSGAQANLITNRAALEASRAAYARTIGTSPGTLEAAPALPALPVTLDEAYGFALDSNPTLVAAREAEVASRRDVSVQKGALLPSLSARLNYTYSEEPLLRDSINEGRTATAQLTVPLYQGGATYSRIRQAKENNSADRIRIVETRRQVDEAVTNGWEALQSARARIEAAEQQVRANEIAYEGVEQEAQVGSRTTLDVLDAEQELLDSRVALVRSQRDEYVAAYQLLSAVGGLTAETLGLNVAAYDPEQNYRRVKRKYFGAGVVSDGE